MASNPGRLAHTVASLKLVEDNPLNLWGRHAVCEITWQISLVFLLLDVNTFPSSACSLGSRIWRRNCSVLCRRQSAAVLILALVARSSAPFSSLTYGSFGAQKVKWLATSRTSSIRFPAETWIYFLRNITIVYFLKLLSFGRSVREDALNICSAFVH
jgi:hypothetical protein